MGFPTDSIEELLVWIVGLVIIYTVLQILIGGGISFIFWIIGTEINLSLLLILIAIIIVFLIILISYFRSKESKPVREEYHILNANELNKFDKKCSKCGNKIVKENTKICPKCGFRIK